MKKGLAQSARFLARCAASLCLLAAVTACTPKVDGSSAEAFDASVEKMSKEMTPEQRRQFKRDLVDASDLGKMTIAHLVDGNIGAQLNAEVRKQLGGKTAEQVHAAAEVARAEARERRKADLRKQADDYQAQIDELARGDAALTRIQVLEAGQAIGEDPPRTPGKVIELPVQNDSEYTVTSVYAVVPGWKFMPPAWFLLKSPVPPGGKGVAVAKLDDFSPAPSLPMKVTVVRADIKTPKFERTIPTTKGIFDDLQGRVKMLEKQIAELAGGK